MTDATTILIAVVSVSAFWEFAKFICDKLITKFGSKKEKQLDRIEATVDKMQDDLKNNSEITTAISRDRVNFLCDKYMELGHIPRKEYVAFSMLGEAYIKKNNSEVKTKYQWVINNLKVK